MKILEYRKFTAGNYRVVYWGAFIGWATMLPGGGAWQFRHVDGWSLFGETRGDAMRQGLREIERQKSV